jgi:uncharacterized protein (TIGR03118 family)
MFRTLCRSAVRPSYRPRIEALEDRNLLSMTTVNVLQTNIVSDLPGVAQVQDPNLVNPWGLSSSTGSPFWVSDNNAGVSTLYNPKPPAGTPIIQSLVVSIPTPVSPTGGTPTGTVFNTGKGAGAFDLTKGNGQPATFLFDTEDGTIIGWNGGTEAVLQLDNSGNNFTNPDPNAETGAVYKGLAIATSATAIIPGDSASTSLLYAANFRSGQIEVYDSKFNQVTTTNGLSATAFTDPNLPAGYAPFDVQVLNGQLYVTYALQDAQKHDDVAGPGHGFVDRYNLDGSAAGLNGTPRLVSGGALNSPWGLAIAPSTYGQFAGDLLVGNFGDGHIHADNPSTGALLGTLVDPDGEPIQIDGLWALRVGNGGQGGDPNTIYFTAGLDHETHGLFGSLSAVAPGSPEGPAEQQMVTADLDIVQLDLATIQTDLSTPGTSAATLQQDFQTLHRDFVTLVQAEVQFAVDARNDAGLGDLHHHHNDDDFFASLGDDF